MVVHWCCVHALLHVHFFSNHLNQQTDHHLQPVLNIINRTCGSSQPAYYMIKGKSSLHVKKTKTNLINSALSSETYKTYFSAKVKSTTSTILLVFLKALLDFFNRSCRMLTLNDLKNNSFCDELAFIFDCFANIILRTLNETICSISRCKEHWRIARQIARDSYKPFQIY